MARAGVASRPSQRRASARPTRQALVDAAVDVLRSEGFAGASARAIAERADCNQALVFYYFGSVADLLLAALDEVSRRRMDRYEETLSAVDGPAQLVETARTIFSEDLDHGYVAVLAQMIAGATTTPDLGTEVAARIDPWVDFAGRALSAGLAGSPLANLVPFEEASRAVVALYLGLEMLSHLDGNQQRSLDLFDRAMSVLALLGLVGSAGTAATAATERRSS